MPSPLSRLLALPRYADAGAAAYKPGLERMRALLEAMGHPERAFPSVVVGGTNGKGSTASFAAAILTAAGRRVGLHTSPHLVSVTERMRVDGRPAPEEWLEEAAGRWASLIEKTEASFFEVTTALALEYFARAGVDVAVIEVGMGGRLDATAVLSPVATAVTNVSLDHTEVLGGTIAQIAVEKAGIARAGVPFLTTAAGEVLDVLRREVEAAGAVLEDVRSTVGLRRDGNTLSLVTPAGDYIQLAPGLPGAHQDWNAALAVRLVEIVAPGVSEQAVRAGLADVALLAGLRGRGETPAGHPRLVLDVAHNEASWSAALESAGRTPGRLIVLIGVMADKDAGALTALLHAAGHPVIPVELPSPRALPGAALESMMRAAGVEVLHAPASVAAAIDWFEMHAAETDRLLVTGSHVTVAEAIRAIESRAVST